MLNLRHLVVVGALAAALATPCLAQETTPSEAAALEAYRQGSFSKAVQLYTKALSETPDASHRAQLHVRIAWTLFALGREAEVDTHLQAALVEDPTLTLVPDYYTQDFLDLFAGARRKAAELSHQRQGTPAPDLEATLVGVTTRLASKQDLEAALADVDRLIVTYPQDTRLVPVRLQVLEALGRPLDAPLQFEGSNATGVDPLIGLSSVPELILRANQLLDDGDMATSLELLREAVSRQPSNVAALELMAEAARRSARWQEAAFALKSALALQPDNIGLQLRLGEVNLALGDISAARDSFQQLTRAYPNSDRAWASLGLLDARLSAHDRAMTALEKALTENPLLPEAQLAYGELLLLSGRVQEAVEAFQSAANLLHNDPQLEARLGQALLAGGRAAEALPLLRSGVTGGFAPDDVRRSLAVALLQGGLLAEASRTLADLSPAGRGTVGTELVRAALDLEDGKLTEAEAALARHLAGHGNDPAFLNLVGVVAYRQRRFADAATALTEAAALDTAAGTVTANLRHAQAAAAAQALLDNSRPVPTAPAK